MQREIGIYPAKGVAIRFNDDGGMSILPGPNTAIYDNQWGVENAAAVAAATQSALPAGTVIPTLPVSGVKPSEIAVIIHPGLDGNAGTPWVATPIPAGPGGEVLTMSAGEAKDLPMPSKAVGQHSVTISAPRGELYLRVRLPADAVDGPNGWFKGRSIGADNFAVGYSLSSVKGHFFSRAVTGDMGFNWHVGPSRDDGLPSLEVGQDYWLNIDKQFDGDLVIQVTRPDANQK